MRKNVDLLIGVTVSAFSVWTIVWMASQPGFACAQEDAVEIHKSLNSSNEDIRLQAIIDAGKLDEPSNEVIDKLLELTIDRNNELVRIAANQSLARHKLLVGQRVEAFLRDDDGRRYLAGLGGVSALGAEGVKWLPLIMERLKSTIESSNSMDDSRPDELRQALMMERAIVMGTMFTIADIGPEAAPATEEVIPFLKSQDFNIQQAACRAIAAIGPAAKSAAPDLVKLIETGVVSARTWGMIALASVGPVDGIDTVGILRGYINAFPVTDRERSLEGLAIMGPLASEAAEDVWKLMNDPARSVEAEAAYAYWRITGKKEPVLDKLTGLLRNYNTRNTALRKLELMGEEAAPATAPILELLTCDEAGIRESALYALKAIGKPVAEHAIRIRIVAETDEDPIVRNMASELLASLVSGPDDSTDVPSK